jgi:pimeloyl-ACP methyl ester carboxylesterase
MGAPTVVLEAGLGETAASFAWISSAIARDTTVCVYDRLGRGWSDRASVPQVGLAVARHLHALLDRGHVRPPFVLVGYSSGAAYVRIFASEYPEAVAGMVLLDGQPPDAFEGLPDYPAFYGRLRRATALLPLLARAGVGRLVFHRGFTSLPAEARDAQRLHYSSVRHWHGLRDEVAVLPASLAQARSLRSLGTRPLIVLTAARNALDGWLPLQEQMASLSTNSRHRVVPYTHEELVSDRAAAVASSTAIRDVVQAVRSGTALE